MTFKRIAALVAIAAACSITSGCTSSNTMRTSQNEAIITTSAAPICGGVGAARAGQKQAAIETIKAGYDRYIIMSGASANNVRSSQMPGTYNTAGTVNSYGGYSSVQATTTYSPGATIYSGTHDQAIGIHMFKDGEPGSAQALSAREGLGPEWAKIVKEGVRTCS
jgi:hypothetical protein